ncbi:MAG: ribose-phosphate pyrophosphokinase [Candidatus Wolfebacteria bacterium]|nr:ribose-phosphate pyrophosphokinase [Candidatus Wolfebacteria bacterium]
MTGNTHRLCLFAGSAHPELAQEIAELLNVPLGKIHVRTFPDSETHVQIEESVRGADIFIIQPTSPPVNENLMELLVMLDAFRRASAGTITAVVPYYGYARQDRKSTGREPISARLVADLLTQAGANRVVSVDLHVAQIQGFFQVPMDHLTSMETFVDYLRKKDLQNAVVVSPDVGRAKSAEKYASILNLPMALMHKRRTGIGGTEVEVMETVGDVRGKTPIVVDDVTSSGSISEQAKTLAAAGANPCYILATHGVLIDKALERLADDCICEVVVTNTVPVPEWKKEALPKLHVLSIASTLAKAIAHIFNNESVSQEIKKFAGENVPFAV